MISLTIFQFRIALLARFVCGGFVREVEKSMLALNMISFFISLGRLANPSSISSPSFHSYTLSDVGLAVSTSLN